MSPKEFVEKLTQFVHLEERCAYLQDHFELIEPADRERFVNDLLDQVIGLMRKDVRLSIEMAEMILGFADLTGNALHRAVGLRAKAQAMGNGNGLYQESLPLFEEALEIHRRYADDYGEALVCLTYIWALANVSRFSEAIARGEWAIPILREKGALGKLASLYNNLGLVYYRVENYARAEKIFTEAIHLYKELGGTWLSIVPGVSNNRALALYNLGEFRQAAQAASEAIALAENYEQMIVRARAQHNLGIIRFFQGKYHEALQLYEDALTTHKTLAQAHEVAMCKLSKTDCLLELRQFKGVIKTCEEIIPVFQALNLRKEQAEAMRNRASALAGLKRFDQAISGLEEARQLFHENGHLLRTAYADFQRAVCFRQTSQISVSIETALTCTQIFDQHNLTLDAALARLLMGWGLAAEGEISAALKLAEEVFSAIQTNQWFQLRYQVYHLKGYLAQLSQQPLQALADLTQAVEELEALRGNAILEHRANFVEDKQLVYEELIRLWLDQGEVRQALVYVERAKSRTLQDMVQSHADIGLESRNEFDEPLIAKIRHLREEREQKLRYAIMLLDHASGEGQGKVLALQQAIQDMEDEITELYHQLMVRNKDYAQDVSRWELKAEDVQKYLDPDTLLLEYFVLENQFVVFVVGGEGGRGRVYHLPLKPFQVERLTYQLNLNYAMVAGYAHPSVAPVDESLIRQAQGLLSKLYQALLLPLEGALQHAKKLVIVPHGPLHSVPFHALFDQHQYLIEKYQISYVPVASLLGHCKAITPAAQGCLIFGHSSEGRLPFAVEEAQKVAALWGEAAFCENQAQIAFLRTHVAQQRLIHLACHGEFHADNALFSGLVLADGSLTTLDVYALRLQASLITLSACQTGQNIIGGGDELLGLMRAFLAAGTRSLLLTLWPVADLSTIQWMERFYTWLMEQKTKGQAVQLTQMEFIRGAGDYAPFRHPFFWAPFFLVGDDGEM